METTTASGPSSPVLTEPTSWPTSASPPSAAPSKPQSPYAIVYLPTEGEKKKNLFDKRKKKEENEVIKLKQPKERNPITTSKS